MPSRIRIQNELVLKDRNLGIGTTQPTSKLSINTPSNSQALDIGRDLKVSGEGVFNPSITIGSTVGAASTQKINLTVVSRENGLFEFENYGGNQLFSVSNDQSNELFTVNRYYNFDNLTRNRKMFSVDSNGNISGVGTFSIGYNGNSSSSYSQIYDAIILRPAFSTSISQSVNIIPKISDKGSISFESPVGTALTNRGTQLFSISNNLDNSIFRVNDLNRNPLIEASISGNVGIGTTNPNSKFQILGSLSQSNGLSVLALGSNDRVGVGTTNPIAKLQVNGSFRVSSVGSTSNQEIDFIHTKGVGVGTTFPPTRGVVLAEGLLDQELNGGQLVSIVNDNTSLFTVNRFLGLTSTNYAPAGQRNIESVFQITSSGGVGVGTTFTDISRDIKLQVIGGTRLSSIGASTLQEIDIRHIKPSIGNTFAPSRGSIVFDGVLDPVNNTGGSIISIINDNTSLFTVNRFLGLTSTNYAPAGQRNIENVFEINLNGNVGVGTSIPTTKLDVRGNINVSGVSTVGLGSTSTPLNNSTFSFELTNNNTLTVRVRGTDGVVRTGIISLT